MRTKTSVRFDHGERDREQAHSDFGANSLDFIRASALYTQP